MADTSALSRVRQAIQHGDLATLRAILAIVSIEDLEAEVVNVRVPGVEVDLKQIQQPTSAIDYVLTLVAVLIAACCTDLDSPNVSSEHGQSGYGSTSAVAWSFHRCDRL